MADGINSALSAIGAYTTMMNNSAQNVANLNTEPYKPRETVMQDAAAGGVSAMTVRNHNVDRVDLSKEAVDMKVAEYGIKANIAVLKREQEAQKTIIDIIA